ncbi:MAG: S9 family peptidase [Acidobacteria bacterium]|nr:S9 family peptidase [Acidobacteriota bacterium]
MRRALAVFGILASFPGTGADAKAGARVTVDDLMKLRSVVDVRIAPDGQRVAYVVSTPSLDRNAHEAAVFVVEARGGAPRRVAEETRVFTPALPAPRLRWSPDGGRISFLGVAADKPQVFALSPSGGEPARALTSAPEGVLAYEWAPDGKSVAYTTRDAASPEEQRQRKDFSWVIHVDAPDRGRRLCLQPLDGSSARLLTPAEQYVDALTWSPDGREIAYAAAPVTGFKAQYLTRVYAVAPGGGSPRVVVDRPGMNTSPQWSPDGARIAFVSTNGRAELMAPRSLAVVPARGSASAVRIFGLNDAWVNEIVWARDSRSVYVLANDGTYASGEHMFEQPIIRVGFENGRSERVAGASLVYSLSASADGSRLAFRDVDRRSMGDVAILDLRSGKSARLSDVNPELKDLELGKQDVVEWRSFDGTRIWGLLLTPPGRSAEANLPLLVYCHGGPGGGVTHGLFPQFMHTVGQVDPYPVEALAGAGFAILFPMPRGGAGYGEAGQRAIVNAWGETDYRDIMAGVDHLIASDVADPARLGVMGASYGGFLTNWIVTQTGRFKAASSAASISDLADQYLLSDGGEFIGEYFRKPWEARDSYYAHSPLNFADRVTTPLLIQHGERDQRVPIANAWKFYRALKAHGKVVEFDIYPRATHLYYEPMLEREAMKRNLEWFVKWIPPAPVSRVDHGSISSIRIPRPRP